LKWSDTMPITSGVISMAGSSTSPSCSIGRRFGFPPTVLRPKVFIFARRLRRREGACMACADTTQLSRRWQIFFKRTIYYVIITYHTYRRLGGCLFGFPHHLTGRMGVIHSYPPIPMERRCHAGFLVYCHQWHECFFP